MIQMVRQALATMEALLSAECGAPAAQGVKVASPPQVSDEESRYLSEKEEELIGKMLSSDDTTDEE